ncbi:hypothetical protein CLV71_1419 [Actinophytocola oryzae]|uniref:Uncharacterized protein n=1 Tax=Actinophytocola oryzae TaxID=502181 RepID=A0A4R7UPX0_9PSEU|nr:hypothetical protein CLV71_1419 [Actinophytocola oryzae]
MYLFSADGNRMVTRQSSGGDEVWDIADPEAPRLLPLPPLPFLDGMDTHGDVLGAVVGAARTRTSSPRRTGSSICTTTRPPMGG